jgi:rRNA maturation endonuclease Nob1
MEYSCQTYELKCNECGRRYGNRPLSGCPECLAPLEIAYDRLDRTTSGATPRCCPFPKASSPTSP